MNLGRLKWMAVVIPAILMALLVFGLHQLWPTFAMSWQGHALQTALIAFGAYGFSTWVFGILAEGEARILKRSAKLQALNEAAVAISGEQSLHAVLEAVTRVSRTLVGAGYAALHLQAAAGRPARVLTDGTAPLDGPAVPPLQVALELRGQVLGALVLGAPPGGSFSPEDEQIARMLANQAAAAIENVALFEQAERSRIYLERLIAGSQDAIVALDPAGRVQLWNRGAEELYSLPAGQAQGRVLPMVPPDARATFLQRLPGLVAGAPAATGEDQHQTATGDLVPVLLTLSAVEAVPGQAPVVLMIAKDLTAHRRLEVQRRRLALLEERERIGMDLHDGAIQALYAVGLGIQATTRLLPPAAEPVRERLLQATSQLNTVIQDLRGYILDLRPPGLPGRSLCEGLDSLADRLREEGGLEVTRRITAETLADQLPADVLSQLLHVAGEGVSNILRHARARSAFIGLEADVNRLILTLRDDGVGFDPGAVQAEEHRGLRNMRARAALMGGECVVHSAPGRGTELRVMVPLDDAGIPAGVPRVTREGGSGK